MKIFKSVQLFLIAILIIGIATPLSTKAATVKSGDLMKINKTVSNSTLLKGGTADVTLTVKGTPQDSTFVKPNDVILIIDKSGSMQSDNRLNAAKQAAKEFIDLMDLTKHEVGIVDFDNNAYSSPLTTDKVAAKAYVDTIQLGGTTNTSAAIKLATTMLANKRAEAQPTIVIMTDGAANSSTEALAAAKAAKDAGITFYSIALLGSNENPDISEPNKLLKEMASSYDHHHFVLGSVGLSNVYRAIVEEIGLASAYNVTITDTISPELELVPGSYDHHIPKPIVTDNTIKWFISELKSNELSFTYQVRAKDSANAGKYTLAQTSSTFEIGDGSTYSLNTTNPIIEIKNHAPIITSIKENKGLTSGGETVTITGQNFLPGANVYFGSKLATVVSLTGSEVIVTTPSGAQGPITIKVQNKDGQFATGNFNYYANPTITSISPTEGPLAGGNNITVNGSNFLRGATVYINDVEAITTYATQARLSAIVPAATETGTVSIKVINPDQTNVELTNAYTYLAPLPPPKVELTSISTTSGKLEGGELIYLIGKNFDKNVKIFFGNEEAILNSYTNGSKIRVDVPAATTPGLVSVKAENPDGSVSVLTDAYEYLTPPPLPAPEISYLSETSILTNEQKTIYLFGKNISPSSKVFLGDKEVTVSFVTNSKIRIAIPANSNTTTVDVKLINPDGQVALLENGFSYVEPVKKPAPVINTLSTTSGSMSGGETVTITGQNFQQKANVFFGDKVAIMVSLSETEIVVKTPISSSSGLVSVKVVNPDLQEVVINNAYRYQGLQITVTSLSTTSGSIKGDNLVVVYGTNFNNNMTVTVDGKVVPYTYLATNRIRIKMPSATTTGVVQIAIDRDGSTGSIDYTYN